MAAQQVHAFCDRPSPDAGVRPANLHVVDGSSIHHAFADWKTDWEVSIIIEVLKGYYPLTEDDSFMSASAPRSITVDKTNIDQLRKSYSEHLISAMEDYGGMPEDRESLLLEKFAKVFGHLSNPSKEATDCSSLTSLRNSRRMRSIWPSE